MKATLIIPTLNEIEAMRQIMPRIRKEWLEEIVFIDGHSTDGTIEYIKELGYTIVFDKETGLRDTVTEVINQAKGDIIITFSPDGNCIPELIPELIKKMEDGYDMVIVSRYLEGAKSYDDNLITAFGNWMFTTLINILHGGKYTDTMGIYRAYKKEVFKELELGEKSGYEIAERLFKTRISIEPLLSIRAAKKGLKIAEIPGDEPDRIGGKAKLKVVRWGCAYLFQVFREVFVWK